jgi:hypothetical protein
MPGYVHIDIAPACDDALQIVLSSGGMRLTLGGVNEQCT